VLVNRVLAARGFTTVRAPGEGAYSVVRLADAPGLAPVVDGGPGPLGPAPGFRASVVRVRHRPARDLVEPLSKVLGRPSGSVTPLDESLLLLADLAPRVEQAESLLALLDRPAAAPVVEEIRLTTLTPAQMAAVFAQLVAKRRVVAGAEAPAELVPLPESGSVMLIATEGAVPHWRAVIADLDGRDRVETRTAVPRHHPAADVASLLERTVRPGADDRFRVVVDELTGSLIVTATPAQHEAVEGVLTRLADAPPSARRPVRSFVVRNRSVREVQAILEELITAGVIEAAAEEPAAPGPTEAPAVVPMPPPPAGADADRTPAIF
jgi:Bacterial type II/III secretion system short domain.